jgi:hypothetical protein
MKRCPKCASTFEDAGVCAACGYRLWRRESDREFADRIRAAVHGALASLPASSTPELTAVTAALTATRAVMQEHPSASADLIRYVVGTTSVTTGLFGLVHLGTTHPNPGPSEPPTSGPDSSRPAMRYGIPPRRRDE